MSADARLLLDLLDEAFDKKSWHGPNLRSSIRGVTATQAAWRPQPGAHNIWELTLHAAYWKYVVRRRITGEKRGSFVLAGSNFFPRPLATTEAAWRRTSAFWRPSIRNCGTLWRSYLQPASTKRIST